MDIGIVEQRESPPFRARNLEIDGRVVGVGYERLSIGAMLPSGAIALTFSVIPTFLRFANRRQPPVEESTAESQGFLVKVGLQPVVTEPVDIDEIDGLGNAALGDGSEIGIPADGLNDHALNLETLLLEKQAVVVELNSPIESIFHAVIPKFFAEFGEPFARACLVHFARRHIHFVNAQSAHELVAGRDLEIAERAVGFVKQFAEEIELARSDGVVKSDFGKNTVLSIAFIDGVKGLTLESIENGSRVHGVFPRLLQERLTDTGNEFGHRRLRHIAIQRLCDRTQRRQEHAARSARAVFETIRDGNELPVGADEFSSRHFYTSKGKAPHAEGLLFSFNRRI